MLFENVDQLLQPGHLPMETGYYCLPNGQMYVAVLTRMTGCKAKWVEWWFKSHVIPKDDQRKRKTDLFPVRIPKKDMEFILNAEHEGKYVMDKELTNKKVEFVNPVKYFDKSSLNQDGVRVVMCVDEYFADGSNAGHVIHMVRNTVFGCEMRSHFWINNCNEEEARTRMEHCYEDMGGLADYLRTLIIHVQQLTNQPDISCKFCHSDYVVKYGLRKNGQYWLCKSCGHHFLNNKALPRMRYPIDAISKAVSNYSYGRPLSSICTDIEADLKVAPSKSAVYGWKKKLTKIATTD